MDGWEFRLQSFFLERASGAAHLNSTQWRTTLLQRPPKWQHMSEGLQSVLPRPLTRLRGLSSRPLRRALNYWTRTSKECCFVQVSVFLLYFASLKIFARCCFYTGAQNLWEKVLPARERQIRHSKEFDREQHGALAKKASCQKDSCQGAEHMAPIRVPKL